MLLEELPVEIYLLLGETALDQPELNALARASTWSYGLLTSVLYLNNASTTSSALHWGARHNLPGTITKALWAKADIEAIWEKETPLTSAAKWDNLEVAKLLLDRKAQVDNPNGRGETALDSVGPRDARLKKTFEGSRYNPGVTIQMTQVKLDMVKLLLDYGASPSIPGKWGATLLHEAVMNMDNRLIELLIEYGADVSAVDSSGNSPLCHAMTLSDVGALSTARLLLANGASANRVGTNGVAPVHSAAVHGNIMGMQLLREFGADFGQPDRAGNTPLQVALNFKHKEFAYAIMEAGARTEVDLTTFPALAVQQARMMESPLHMALGGKDWKLFRTVLAHDPDSHVRTMFTDLRFEDYDNDEPALVLGRKGFSASRVKTILLARIAQKNKKRKRGKKKKTQKVDEFQDDYIDCQWL